MAMINKMDVENQYTSKGELVPVHITIKAEGVIDNLNGTFTIRLTGKALSMEQQRMLEILYPRLYDKAYDLLNQEALLSALATPAEKEAEPMDAKSEETRSRPSSGCRHKQLTKPTDGPVKCVYCGMTIDEINDEVL